MNDKIFTFNYEVKIQWMPIYYYKRYWNALRYLNRFCKWRPAYIRKWEFLI